MTTRTRMNVYFAPDLLAQVEALALRRQVSKSAVVEAAVASFLSGDSSDRLEAAMSRRLDKLGREIHALDEDLAVLGETVSLFVNIWLPPRRRCRRARRPPPARKVPNGSRVSCRRSAGVLRPATGSSKSCRAMSIRFPIVHRKISSRPMAA